MRLNNLRELTELARLNELKISGNNLGPKEAERQVRFTSFTLLILVLL